MFKKILTPVDGTGFSESVLTGATDLAAKLGAELTVLSVIDPHLAEHTPDLGDHAEPGEVATPAFQRFLDERHTPTSGPTGGVAYASQVIDRAKVRVQKHLVELIPTVNAEGAVVVTEVREGSPAEQINLYAAAGGFDLIVMATRGRGALMRGLLGGVADKVLRTSSIPVLVIKPESENNGAQNLGLANILLAVDGTAHGEAPVAYVEDIAAILGSKVTVLRVVPTGGPYTGLWDDARLMDVYPEILTAAREYAEGVASKLRAKGIVAEARVVEGLASNVVIEVADEVGADLIALAPKGLSGLSRFVLGSVTETAVRHSHRPVLVVPPAIAAQDLD